METLLALLGTAAGKAVAAAAIAAAGVGGLAAADVDLPIQANDPPADVSTDNTDLPDAGDDAATEEADVAAKKAAAQQKRADAQENGQDDTITTEDEGGDPNENADFGQGVALDAQDGGVDGPTIAGMTPAGDRPAPPEAGELQDADVEDDAETDEQPPADPGSQADEYRPAGAGSQAEGRP